MKRIVGFLFLGLLGIGALIGYNYYKSIYLSNTNFEEDHKHFYLETGVAFDQMVKNLSNAKIINDAESFEKVCELKSFHDAIKPGHYIFNSGMCNNDIVNKLRSGDQDPVRVVVGSARTFEEFAGKIAYQIEADSSALVQTFIDRNIALEYGFNRDNFKAMFIPNTYEMWWNTSPKEFVAKMAEEFKKFWTEDRKAAARKLGLQQSEVYTLASIVKAETAKTDEAPVIAGVYLNRLRIGMALQADPTVKYAVGDFELRRILDKHLSIDSPYNTYKYPGLPPGPINFPEHNYIEAVLYPQTHKYLYFCAKPDFSGYHNFAKTLSQHNVNARKYQRELNKNKIYR